MNFGDIKNIHFVGIGGIGMSGLAEILTSSGVRVSGCDLRRSAVTDLLLRRGVAVEFGHDPAHVEGVDAIVVTSAIRGANAEVDAARSRGVRVIRRSELLGQIVNSMRGIGISGTHGKTTTSAMVSTVLEEAGYDPTVLVGGVMRNLSSNAKVGKGDFVVVEADEYDRTFHQLQPEIAIVTNIEADHLEYYGSFEAIVESFHQFLRGVRRTVIGCVDDPAVAELLQSVGSESSTRIISYGLGADAQLRAVDLEFDEYGTAFSVPGVGAFKLFVPGEHNVRNALAAIGAAREVGIEPAAIARALSKFLGVDRRFQILGAYRGAVVVDDYAHHPTEIRATLSGARRAYPRRRLVALFQPHLYSRTRDFAAEFNEALRIADVPLLAPIYAAREEPMSGVTSKLIADAAPGVEFLDKSHDQIVADLRERLGADDIFVAMGAGDVHEIAEALVVGGAA